MLRRTDLQLLPTALLLWGLAVLGIHVGQDAAVAALVLLVCAALLVILLIGRRVARDAVAGHLCLLLLGAVLLVPALQRHEASLQVLRDAAGPGAILELSATASGDAEEQAPLHPRGEKGGGADPSWTVQIRTDAGAVRAGRIQASMPSRMRMLAIGSGASGLAQVRDGDRIHVRGTVQIQGSLILLRVHRAEVIAPLAGPAAALVADARDRTSMLPADEAALVRGMTTGDTSGLSPQVEEQMRRAGISHLVAVSGANIALVLAAVLLPALLLGMRRRPRILLAAAVAAGYVLLVGDEPSVQRAATMAAPLLAARLAGVRASPVGALCATVAIWAVADPSTSAQVGFLLSALATGAILVLAPALARSLHEASGRRVPAAICLALAVPLVAQIACQPILVLLAPEVSLWAVPVNLAVGPIVGPVTILGLAATALGPVLPGAAELLWRIAGGGAHLVIAIARLADGLPGSRVSVPEGAAGAGIVLAIVAAGVIGVFAARRHPIVRWMLAAFLVAALAPLAPRATGPAPGQDWSLAMCAVGQGDAVLLRAAADPAEPAARATTVLIDTGPDPAALTECLNTLHVKSIELLVLTHPHVDHTGGIAALTGDRTPQQQWICPLPAAAGSTVADVPSSVAITGTRWEQDGLALEVLWPLSAEAAEQASRRESGGGEGDAANDCSIVIAAAWPGGERYVGLGDLEPVAQEQLLGSGALESAGLVGADRAGEEAPLGCGQTCVVKVAHHGSRRQDPALYAALSADLLLYSAGRDNSFGHPTAAALDLALLSDAAAVRTDEHGTVVLPRGEELAPRSVGPGR